MPVHHIHAVVVVAIAAEVIVAAGIAVAVIAEEVMANDNTSFALHQ